MKALLIDPWQRTIHQLQVGASLDAWHQVLQCGCVDRLRIHRNPQGTRAVDVWVDDEGMLRHPVPPCFAVKGYLNSLAGYGLVLGANLTNGKSIDCNLGPENIGPLISFERWEERLNPADYFEQLTRVPSWEIAAI